MEIPLTKLRRPIFPQLFQVALRAFAICLGGNGFADTVPDLVAHRGASENAPENTLAAIDLAWKEGADAVEIDVRLTADHVIALMHDTTALRTTGEALIIADSDFEALASLDAGSWKGPQWEGEPVPRLEDALANVPENKRIFVEIKCGPEILPALKACVAESTLRPHQLVFISFNADVIRETRTAFPACASHWLTGFRQVEDQWRPTIEETLETLGSIDASGLDCNASERVDAHFAQALRDHDYEFHVWTVDSKDVARRFVELGVDSITTNRPKELRSALSP